MRLGVNATFLNDTPTGVGVYTREVSARLCDLNDKTHVFTSVQCDIFGESFVERTPSSVQGSLSLLPNLRRFIYINTRLRSLARRRGVDVLYCPIVEFPFYRPCPLVVTVHDLHPIYFPEQFGLAARHFRLSLRVLPKIVSRIIVPSRFVKRDLLDTTGLDAGYVDVVPNGYDSELFKPRKEDERAAFLQRYGIKSPFILFVGSLFPYKNVTCLINSFMEVSDRIPHCLVIAGKKELSPGPLREDERIVYLDYVPHDELPGLYSFADMLVHPSLAEGFGMTVLEAMACGTPVIVSDRGSLPEVAGDAGLLFDPDDKAALGRLILDLVGNRTLREDLVRKGLSHVRRYSWDRTAEGILESCGQVFRGSR